MEKKPVHTDAAGALFVAVVVYIMLWLYNRGSLPVVSDPSKAGGAVLHQKPNGAAGTPDDAGK